MAPSTYLFLVCMFISMEMSVLMETLIQVEMCMYKLSERANRNRKLWTMKMAYLGRHCGAISYVCLVGVQKKLAGLDLQNLCSSPSSNNNSLFLALNMTL